MPPGYSNAGEVGGQSLSGKPRSPVFVYVGDRMSVIENNTALANAWVNFNYFAGIIFKSGL